MIPCLCSFRFSSCTAHHKTAVIPVDIPSRWEPRAKQQPTGLIAYGAARRRPVQVLFRTEKDGPFTNEDMFYLQAIGMHLNAVLYQITHSLPQTNDLKQTLARLKNTCHLTNRELQIAEQIYQYRNNDEIAGSLGIRENTLQKHLQNIFRKTNVTSRWELLRFRMR